MLFVLTKVKRDPCPLCVIVDDLIVVVPVNILRGLQSLLNKGFFDDGDNVEDGDDDGNNTKANDFLVLVILVLELVTSQVLIFQYQLQLTVHLTPRCVNYLSYFEIMSVMMLGW